MKIRDLKTGRFLPEGLTIDCKQCGKVTPVKRATIYRKQFCSKACFYVSKTGKKQSAELIEKRRLACIGKKRSDAFRQQLSRIKQGAGNAAWRGGVTPERVKLSNTVEYKQWRNSIFERDNYTCKTCGKRGVELNADHIVPWWKDESLRFDIKNGQTLCKQCHTQKTREEGKLYWINQNGMSSYHIHQQD